MAGTYLTKAGVVKLEDELKRLTTQKHRLSKEVGTARELGDLRENAEYHAAKERLQQVVQKIIEIQTKLSHVEIVDSSQLVEGLVTIGTQIRVKNLEIQKEETYILVGPDESDPPSGKISIQSPLGKGFIGHKVKEKITITLPGGSFSYQILSVQPFEFE